MIPRHYRAPNLAEAPDEEEATGFGFTLFLPDYSGWTVELGKDYPSRIMPWDENMIWVLRVVPNLSTDADSKIVEGNKVTLVPAERFDPETLLKNATEGLEVYYEEFGLKCYGEPCLWRIVG